MARLSACMEFGIDPARLDQIEEDDPILAADMLHATLIRRAEQDRRDQFIAKLLAGGRL